jgi:hypothetical protein
LHSGQRMAHRGGHQVARIHNGPVKIVAVVILILSLC